MVIIYWLHAVRVDQPPHSNHVFIILIEWEHADEMQRATNLHVYTVISTLIFSRMRKSNEWAMWKYVKFPFN